MTTIEGDYDTQAIGYLRDREIPCLVEEIVEHLVSKRPDDPVKSIADFLATLNEEKRKQFASPGKQVSSFGVSDGLGMNNLLLMSDSYKFSHYVQYPKGTTKVYSYFESRGGKYPQTVLFGLQYYIKKYLTGVVVTPEKIAEAKHIIGSHLPPSSPFNEEGWKHIWEKHGGKLPIRIKAVPEGTVVDTKNVLFTMENTDEDSFWLTNFLETLLVQVWYPMTVATHSRSCKKLILNGLRETGDESLIDFKLHDFGFRGVSSVESAGTGGAGHLVNFLGTDTLAGILTLRDYYGAEIEGAKCPGYSIPASEHSTITAWGRDNEVDAMENMLDQYKDGLVACVSDSYDIYKACREYWGTKLKDKILGRDGTLVVRPDSGEVEKVSVEIHEILYEKFGGTVNEKGYKVINPKIRIIWGDGIDHESLGKIIEHLKSHKWSIDNIAFGSGGGLLQKLHRDTQKCAFKCSYACVKGTDVDVFKDPITDPGKQSKRGRLTLHKNADGKWETKMGPNRDEETDQLVEVYCDGELKRDYSLPEIRERAKQGL
eukprot:Hpha_TRINITY_DN780_c0_g1::TRINITY_DN780_c0_g1_i1::g.28879::m.28879/K03462/NAMPT; nicotinamide phosphoribosyltransferase